MGVYALSMGVISYTVAAAIVECKNNSVQYKLQRGMIFLD
jgi:hypothetical protein